MNKLNESFIENKKSKFYGYLYNIKDINDVDDILYELKQEHKKAKHIVYAYKIGQLEKKYEDKEPQGSAAAPILGLINIKKLDNTAIFVVRYFGGILLGRGLLGRSYKEAANRLFK